VDDESLTPAAILTEEQSRHLARFADRILIPRDRRKLARARRWRTIRSRLGWVSRFGSHLDKLVSFGKSVVWVTVALVAAESRGWVDMTWLPAAWRSALGFVGGLG